MTREGQRIRVIIDRPIIPALQFVQAGIQKQ
jgi:hypothetical protein